MKDPPSFWFSFRGNPGLLPTAQLLGMAGFPHGGAASPGVPKVLYKDKLLYSEPEQRLQNSRKYIYAQPVAGERPDLLGRAGR